MYDPPNCLITTDKRIRLVSLGLSVQCRNVKNLRVTALTNVTDLMTATRRELGALTYM